MSNHPFRALWGVFAVAAAVTLVRRARAEEPVEAPQVTVASTRIAPDVEEREATPMTVIGREELERTGSRNAGDGVAQAPGVTTDGPHNTRDRNRHAGIRGFDPKYTLVLMDGQRVTSSEGDGKFDLSSVPAESIDRIEIIKGPQAIIYGSDAIGGIVNVVTQGSSFRPGHRLDLGYGSFNTYSGFARAAWRLPANLQLRLDARFEKSEGWSDEYDYDSTLRQASAKEDARGTDRGHATATLRYAPSTRNLVWLQGRLSAQRAFKHKVSTKYVDGGVTEGTQLDLDYDATLGWQWSPTARSSLTTTLHLYRSARQRKDLRHSDLNLSGRPVGTLNTDERDDVVDWTGGVNTIWRQRSGKHLITALASADTRVRLSNNQRRRVQRDTEGNIVSDADFREPSKIYGKRRSVVAVAAQDVWSLLAPLDVTLGARLEHDSVFGTFLAPASTLKSWVNDWAALRSSVGLGFRSPGVDSLTRSPVPTLDVNGEKYRAGNPDLKPEHSLSHELSFDADWPERGTDQLPRLRATATLFHTEFRDKIETRVTDDFADGLPLEQEVNIGSAFVQGGELELRCEVTRAITVGGNQTKLRTRNRDLGSPLDRVATSLSRGWLAFDIAVLRSKLQLTVSRTGSARKLTALGNEERLIAAYTTVGASTQHRLTRHISLVTQFSNVLGEEWDKDGDGDTDLPPLSFFVTLRGEI